MQADQIVIDGSLYEGGGQMIRSSIALSIITKKEFTMHSIRKNRPNAGINNQLRSVLSAFTEKLPKVGEQEIYFYPKFFSPDEIKANTAASCTLMMQCIVPVFTFLNIQKSIKITGGTDVSRSPPLQSISLGLIPMLNKIGINLKIVDVKKGYFPVGKGYVEIQVQPGENINPMKIIEIGKPEKVVITYYVKDRKPPASSKQFSRTILKMLKQCFGENTQIQMEVKAEKVFNTKDDYGIGCIILGDNLIWDVGTVGEKVTEDKILDRLEKYCQNKPAIDEHHQDQLLIYLSLANGVSQLHIGQNQSLHTQSLIYVINSFLPEVKFDHDKQTGILRIAGVGLKRGQKQ